MPMTYAYVYILYYYKLYDTVDNCNEKFVDLKVHSGLRQFLTIEGLLKMISNAFDFTSKSLFILWVFRFLS